MAMAPSCCFIAVTTSPAKFVLFIQDLNWVESSAKKFGKSYIGTVPTYKMNHIGTIPMFKMHHCPYV